MSGQRGKVRGRGTGIDAAIERREDAARSEGYAAGYVAAKEDAARYLEACLAEEPMMQVRCELRTRIAGVRSLSLPVAPPREGTP